MKLRVMVSLAIVVAVAAAAADNGYSLDIEKELRRPTDPRTEARLAQWNSPIGRVMHNMNEQQTSVLRGGQPGAGSAGGVAIRFRVQGALPLSLVTATTGASVDFYERTVAVIRWPWRVDDRAVLTIDEQLSLLLGNRLGSPPQAGNSE